MATVALQRPSVSGTTLAYAAASAGGDKFEPGERTVLIVKTGGTAATVTVVTPNTVFGLAVADVSVALGTNAERVIGPFPREHFAGSDGLVSVSWSATAGVTFAPLAV